VRLTSCDFERLMRPFEPFEKDPLLAVAVSGGRDSMALALLAGAWVAPRGGRLLAFIVDHALRAGSAAEATAVRAVLGKEGIEAEILRWDGHKPQTGIQQAARAARYRLIFAACRHSGILHLLVGHHADDQAETISMRARRASGPDGLAGMAALVEHRDLRLLRPLLGVSRERLTATLQARGISWVEDASNSDLRFERARLRATGELRGSPVGMGQGRSAAETLLAEACTEVLEFGDAGELAVDRGAFARLAGTQRAALLSRVIQAIGGGDHPPRRERLQRAVDRLAGPIERGKSGKAGDFTFAACRLALRRAPGSHRLYWRVRPEKGKKPGQPLIPAAFFACGASGAHHVD
jgi:tRNA(Ile)-lysidine synthase